MIQIKFIGRGGQGGKTAAYLAAEAAFHQGKEVQAFPEFGPEREGAPVFAFTRISEKPIIIHSAVQHPDIVVVIDDTLVTELEVCKGITEDGIVILNTKELTNELKQNLPDCAIFTIDATGIAFDLLGRNIPNMPMLGALSKVSELFALDNLEQVFKKSFSHKLKPELIDRNIKAMERAFNEVEK